MPQTPSPDLPRTGRDAPTETPPEGALAAETNPELSARSLQDRLAFCEAQQILAGMTGCTPQRAAASLLTTAARLELAPDRVAGVFLDGVAAYGDMQAGVLLRCFTDAALSPDPADEPARGAETP